MVHQTGRGTFTVVRLPAALFLCCSEAFHAAFASYFCHGTVTEFLHRPGHKQAIVGFVSEKCARLFFRYILL